MFFRFHAARNYFYSVSFFRVFRLSRVKKIGIFIQNVYQVLEINCWKLKQLKRIRQRQLNKKKCAVYVLLLEFSFWVWVFWAEAFGFVCGINCKSIWICCIIILRYELDGKNNFESISNSVSSLVTQKEVKIRLIRTKIFQDKQKMYSKFSAKIRRIHFSEHHEWKK